jgi:lysophospholipase L1-like esterase
MKTRTVLTLLPALWTVVALGAKERPAQAEWVEAMKKVHQGFDGTAGYVAQFGDSITYSMAFWKPFSWSDPDQFIPDDGLPKRPGKRRWRDVIQGAGDEGKGPEAGNYSGWRVGNLLEVVPRVLKRTRPEGAILMIGSNDARGSELSADYEAGLDKVVELCLGARCVPILSTIPPKRGASESVTQANQIIRATAARRKLPLVDYHAAILERAPDGKWDGTLISQDGVHPFGGETQNFSDENLKKSGYALRNYVTFLKLREVYFRVLHPEETK